MLLMRSYGSALAFHTNFFSQVPKKDKCLERLVLSHPWLLTISSSPCQAIAMYTTTTSKPILSLRLLVKLPKLRSFAILPPPKGGEGGGAKWQNFVTTDISSDSKKPRRLVPSSPSTFSGRQPGNSCGPAHKQHSRHPPSESHHLV